jgi:hypothetical protein
VYSEAVTILVPRLTVEAYDPVAEPVFIDGADSAFGTPPRHWAKENENVYSTEYVWPLRFPTDEQYTTRAGETELFQVFEDEVLLRGYRDPFDVRFLTNKKLVLIAPETWGLAGAYSTIAELDPLFSQGPPINPEIKADAPAPGRVVYNPSEKKLYIASASSGSPETHQYAIPIIPHLFTLAAKNIAIKNLIFTHAAGYAIEADNADSGSIEGCLFTNTHFAVSVKNTRAFSIRNNVVSEDGFWEKYSSADVAGTVYEASAIAVDSAVSAEEIVIENNIIRGAPFFITPCQGKLVIAGNIIARSVFGLFARQFLEKGDQSAYVSTLEVRNNIFHHLDGGINLPVKIPSGANILMYRNCFYLASVSRGAEQTGQQHLPNVAFYHNTVVVAGDAVLRPFPNLLGADVRYLNNIYEAKNLLYSIFVDTGEGTPHPIAFGPLLSYNLLFSAQDASAPWATFEMQGETYLYRKIRRSVPTVKAGDPNSGQPVFARNEPLETILFYHNTFDLTGPVDVGSLYKDGAQSFYEQARAKLLVHFTLHEKSPARNIGRLLPPELPDTVSAADKKPDLGALEF